MGARHRLMSGSILGLAVFEAPGALAVRVAGTGEKATEFAIPLHHGRPASGAMYRVCCGLAVVLCPGGTMIDKFAYFSGQALQKLARVCLATQDDFECCFQAGGTVWRPYRVRACCNEHFCLIGCIDQRFVENKVVAVEKRSEDR